MKSGKTMVAMCGCRRKASFARTGMWVEQNFCVRGFAWFAGQRHVGKRIRQLADEKSLFGYFCGDKSDKSLRGN